jgi:hypothetical protein
MIKIHITFENKDKEAEDTMVSANFVNFEDIQPWLDKVKVLNDDENLTKTVGFLTKPSRPKTEEREPGELERKEKK